MFDDYYDDEPSDYYYERSTLDDFVKRLLEGYKNVFYENGNTLKYVIQEFETNVEQLAFTESSIISSIFYEIQKLEPKVLQVKLMSDLFLVSFYKLKKEKDIFGYLDKFKEKEIKEIADFLHKSGAYRKVLIILMEVFLVIEKMENEERAKREAEEREILDIQNKQVPPTLSDYKEDYSWEDNEEALYWIAVGEGEVDPSDDPPWVKRRYQLDYYDDYEYTVQSSTEIYRNKLRNSLSNTDHYVNLIEDAKDLELTEKLAALRTIDKIVDELPLFNSTASLVLSSLEASGRAEEYLERLKDLMQKYDLKPHYEYDYNLCLVQSTVKNKLSRFSYYTPLDQENHLHSIYLYGIKREATNRIILDERSIEIAKKVLNLLGGFELPEIVWKDLKLFMEGTVEWEHIYDNKLFVIFHTGKDYDNPQFEQAEIRFERINKYKEGYKDFKYGV